MARAGRGNRDPMNRDANLPTAAGLQSGPWRRHAPDGSPPVSPSPSLSRFSSSRRGRGRRGRGIARRHGRNRRRRRHVFFRGRFGSRIPFRARRHRPRSYFCARAAGLRGVGVAHPAFRQRAARDRAQPDEARDGGVARHPPALGARAAWWCRTRRWPCARRDPRTPPPPASPPGARPATCPRAARRARPRAPRRTAPGGTTPAPPSTARDPTARANDSSAICSACMVGNRSSASGASARITISDSAGGYAPIASGHAGGAGPSGRDLVQDVQLARARERRGCPSSARRGSRRARRCRCAGRRAARGTARATCTRTCP